MHHPYYIPQPEPIQVPRLSQDLENFLMAFIPFVAESLETRHARVPGIPMAYWHRVSPWQPDSNEFPSYERVKAPQSEESLQAHQKRTRVDPRSLPRSKSFYRQRFART